MALANYSDLKASIADWIARGDLTTAIPDFIAFAEARLADDLYGNLFESDVTLVTDPNATNPRKVALPADFIEPIKLELVETSVITTLMPQTVVSLAYLVTAGKPTAWAINGTDIDLDRPADAVYSLNFRYRWSFGLSDTVETNWLLTNRPNLYLAVCLVEAYKYTKNQEGVQYWEGIAGPLIAKLNRTLAKSRGNTVLTVDPALASHGRASTIALINGEY